MRNFCKILAALIFICALSGSAVAQTPSRVAIIDLKKVFEKYYKTKQGQTILEQAKSEADKQYKELLDDWKKTKEDYQKIQDSASDQTVSSDERDKRKKSAEMKLRELKETEQTIQQFERRAATKLEDDLRRMRENIVELIRNAVSAKAKADGYSLVIDTAAETVNGTPVVIYNNGENDLTEIILSQLNAGAPVESSKTDDKKEEKRNNP